MANDDKKPKKKLDSSIVSKKMLAIAFMAPFVLSISFMAIAYLTTLNATDIIQTISSFNRDYFSYAEKNQQKIG
jgi:hypothetical protein